MTPSLSVFICDGCETGDRVRPSFRPSIDTETLNVEQLCLLSVYEKNKNLESSLGKTLMPGSAAT